MLSGLVNFFEKYKLGINNIELLSVKIAPLSPDNISEGSRILSPSIFAFYDDQSADNIISLPKVFVFLLRNSENSLKIIQFYSGFQFLKIRFYLDNGTFKFEWR